MKFLCTLMLLIGLSWLFPAGAQHKKRADSVRVTIQFNNELNKKAPVDSVIVIFDRYNLSGAGTIKNVYYPVNNKVVIENVPEGKFYITVICLGIYKDSFTEISYVYEKRRNKNSFNFRLKNAEAYNPTDVAIPSEKIDPLNLLILRKRIMR
jgi:hypothetical protein